MSISIQTQQGCGTRCLQGRFHTCIPNIPRWGQTPPPQPTPAAAPPSLPSRAGKPQGCIQKAGKATNPCGIYSDSRRCRRSAAILSPSSPYPSSPPRDGSAEAAGTPTWLRAWGCRKTHRDGEMARGNVLIPVPHFPSAIPSTCR